MNKNITVRLLIYFKHKTQIIVFFFAVFWGSDYVEVKIVSNLSKESYKLMAVVRYVKYVYVDVIQQTKIDKCLLISVTSLT